MLVATIKSGASRLCSGGKSATSLSPSLLGTLSFDVALSRLGSSGVFQPPSHPPFMTDHFLGHPLHLGLCPSSTALRWEGPWCINQLHPLRLRDVAARMDFMVDGQPMQVSPFAAPLGTELVHIHFFQHFLNDVPALCRLQDATAPLRRSSTCIRSQDNVQELGGLPDHQLSQTCQVRLSAHVSIDRH